MTVKSEPSGARIFVDGFEKGTAPLKVKGLALGEHFVRAVQSSRASTFSKVEVASKSQRPAVLLTLASSDEGLASPVVEVVGIKDLRAWAAHVADVAFVRQVILVEMEARKGSSEMVAMVYDKDSRKTMSYRSNLRSLSDLKPSTKEIVAQLLLESGASTQQVASRQSEKTELSSPKSQEPKAEKKSFFKSPLFWAAIGLAVAGGAVGGVMGLKGGGGGGSPVTDVSVGVTGNAPALRFR
jgi:hypothetical protein